MTTVIHSNFGKGQVVSQDTNNVTVDFNGVVKTLIIKFAKLTNEDGTSFGTQAVAAIKKMKSQKKISEQLKITANTPASWTNADGSKDLNKYNDFLEERKRAAWASIGY